MPQFGHGGPASRTRRTLPPSAPPAGTSWTGLTRPAAHRALGRGEIRHSSAAFSEILPRPKKHRARPAQRRCPEPRTRLWTPVLSVLEADREYPGIAEHIGQLEVIHTADLDCPALLAVAPLHRDGVPLGIAAAIHAVRHLPEWGADALVATVTPMAYESRALPLLDLNRCPSTLVRTPC